MRDLKPHPVTVVIPCYKSLETIERAVKSVLGQPRVCAEVIVVIDDGCIETCRLLNELHEPRLTVLVNDRNSGAPFSRNRGLSIASTSFVMFLDSDDYLAGEILAGLVESLDSNSADIAFGPWIKLDEEINHCSRRIPAFETEKHAFASWLLKQQSIPPCSVLWRAEFLRSIGGWDENLKRVQDGELVLRALLRGARMTSCRHGAGIYFQHTSEHRITSGKDLMPLIEVAEKLLVTETDLLSAAELRDILSRYLYRNAKKAFRNGDVAFARQALKRSRQLGYAANDGSLVARLGATIMGVERYYRFRGSSKA